VCQATGGGGGVDEEVKRVQAECHHLSDEIRRLREDNSKLRVRHLLCLPPSCPLSSLHRVLKAHRTSFAAFSLFIQFFKCMGENMVFYFCGFAL